MNFEGRLDHLDFCSEGNLLAVATSTFKGPIWNGALVILEKESQELKIRRKYNTKGGNTCLAWIGGRSDLIACGGDDSSIHIWSITNKKEKPIRSLREHHDIVSSIAVNPKDKDEIVSGSWDRRFVIRLLFIAV